MHSASCGGYVKKPIYKNERQIKGYNIIFSEIRIKNQYWLIVGSREMGCAA